MVQIVGPKDVIDEIGVTATRIRRFGEAISQGHSFGIPPGEHREPWGLEFHRTAVAVYSGTISWDYLISLARSFSRRSSLMSNLTVPESLAESWPLIREYLDSTSAAILEAVPHDYQRAWPMPSIGHITPPVMPFEKLAALLHEDGIAVLTVAALEVETACLQGAASPPGEDKD